MVVLALDGHIAGKFWNLTSCSKPIDLYNSAGRLTFRAAMFQLTCTFPLGEDLGPQVKAASLVAGQFESCRGVSSLPETEHDIALFSLLKSNVKWSTN